MKRLLVTLTSAFAMLATAASVAQAAPVGAEFATQTGNALAQGSIVGRAVPVVDGAANAAAWSDCPAGDFCIWSGTHATGARCTWSNADSDWFSGSIQCSWADTQPVRSVYNHGTSTSYWGVWFYAGANYTGNYGCLRQGYAIYEANGFARSHRWRTYSC